MGRNIYGTNTIQSSVSLNYVSCYITTAEVGYKNERADGPKFASDQYSFIGFYQTFHGKGLIKTKTHTFVLNENEIVFLYYRDLLSIQALDEEWHFYCHYFFLNNLSLSTEKVFSVKELPNQRARTEQIIRYLNNNDYYYVCRANGLGQAMLCELLTEINTNYYRDPYQQAIQKVVFYINQHVEENISIGELAAQCNVCEKHFRDIFTNQMGMTPKQYILKSKMNRSAFLLTSTSYSVSEISDSLSFLSPAYFIHRFKMFFGVTPTQYRKEHASYDYF